MTRDDSRAQRFARTWLGPPLAAAVGIASAGELAAMPVPRPGAAPRADPDPAVERTRCATTGRHAERAFRPRARFVHRAARGVGGGAERLEELSKAAEAVAATGQLQQELAALQEENQQLRAEIEAGRAERGELENGEAGGRGAHGRADQDGRSRRPPRRRRSTRS